MKKSFLIASFLFLLFTYQSKSQWAIMTHKTDSLVQIGSKHIYNIKFDEARVCFEKVIKLNPNHPAGYFLDAMVEYWKISIFRNTRAYDQIFLNKVEKVLTICDKILVENNTDITALFFKGGILGYRARFYSNSEQWLSATYDAKTAFDIMQQCLIKAPNNNDIMLGTGIYNYFAAAIPEKYPIAKPFMTFLPNGNKKIGILQLRSSALYAKYTPIEAKVTLMQVFYSFENDMNEALFYSKGLLDSFPNNPYFHRYVGRVYVRMSNWDSLENIWRNIVNRSLDKWTGYDNHAAKEGCYYVGLALQRKNEIEKSQKYLFKCVEIADATETEPSGFKSSALLKIGMNFDKLKNRKKAVEYYNRVLSIKDYDGSHEKARNFIKNAYN